MKKERWFLGENVLNETMCRMVMETIHELPLEEQLTQKAAALDRIYGMVCLYEDLKAEMTREEDEM